MKYLIHSMIVATKSFQTLYHIVVKLKGREVVINPGFSGGFLIGSTPIAMQK